MKKVFIKSIRELRLNRILHSTTALPIYFDKAFANEEQRNIPLVGWNKPRTIRIPDLDGLCNKSFNNDLTVIAEKMQGWSGSGRFCVNITHAKGGWVGRIAGIRKNHNNVIAVFIGRNAFDQDMLNPLFMEGTKRQRYHSMIISDDIEWLRESAKEMELDAVIERQIKDSYQWQLSAMNALVVNPLG